MDVQWYPGHMTKARRAMEQDLKLVDLIIEVLDARIPRASRNPELARLGAGKLRMIVLNKADLADPAENERWMKAFRAEGLTPVCMDSRAVSSRRALLQALETVAAAKRERDRARGILNRPVRAMVVGVPNTGKSTFINCLSKKASAKTGNRPGVTRGSQWIRLDGQVELLDTPGVLWPRIDDQADGRHLAAAGSVNDRILNLPELAASLWSELCVLAPDTLRERYGLEDLPAYDKASLAISASRGALLAGGEPDLEKTAGLFLDDFRSGKLGRITLERCEELPDHK